MNVGEPVALKEWAVVVRALLSGRQMLLVRKGGVAEGRDAFWVEKGEFFLLPTYVHQRRELIRPEFHTDFDAVRRPLGVPDRIPIEAFATLHAVHEVRDRGRLDRLTPFHIWTREFVDDRYAFRPDHPVCVLLLRVHRVAPTFEVLDRPEFEGCKSWVHLDPIQASFTVTPVLTDETFAAHVRALEDVLGART